VKSVVSRYPQSDGAQVLNAEQWREQMDKPARMFVQSTAFRRAFPQSENQLEGGIPSALAAPKRNPPEGGTPNMPQGVLSQLQQDEERFSACKTRAGATIQ
jgi:hypothetical protein